jgi:protocatechuate 3,4-dioxygenase beta subunit
MRREGGWLPVALRWVACWSFAVVAWPAAPAPPESESTEDRTKIIGNVTDQAGHSVADAQVQLIDGYSDTVLDETVTDDAGRFELTAEKEPRHVAYNCYVRAETSGGQRMAFGPTGEFRDGAHQISESPLKLELASTVEASVKVVDSLGAPVADCNVMMQLFHFSIRIKQSSGTDGTATFRYPKDSRGLRLFAWKEQQGFAAASFLPDQRDRNAKEPPPFDPTGMTLELAGAKEINVRVVDSDGQPVENARVYPWLLNPPKGVSPINLSSVVHHVSELTDTDGIARFTWIPNWQTDPITFWNSGAEEWTHRRVMVQPRVAADSDGVHATLTIDRLVPLTGRVVDQKGQPAVDAAVSISGRFGESHSQQVRTDADGRYTATVPSRMNYLLTAKKMDGETTVSVADTVDGLFVLPGEPFEASDLKLRTPTIVSGVLKDPQGKPVADERVISYHFGADYTELPAAIQNKFPRPRFGAQPIDINYAQTDSQGRFQFALGDGVYDFRPPNQRTAKRLEITPGSEAELSVELVYEKETEPSDPFGGKVVLPDGSPVAGVKVEAFSDDFRGGWQATTDEQGEFSVLEHRGRKTLRVVSEDQKHAASVTVDEEVSEQTIRLQPTGSVEIALVDEQGKSVNSVSIQLSETLHRTSRPGFTSSFTSRLHQAASTDAKGNVTFSSLIPGVIYFCQRGDGEVRSGRRLLARFKVQPGETYQTTVELKPDLPPRKPYVKPSDEARLQRWLKVTGTAPERYEKALRKIKVYNQKLLIIVGHQGNEALLQWVRIRYGENDYRKVSPDFATMVLRRDQKSKEVDALLERLDRQIPDGDGLTFVVVGQDGKVVEVAGPTELFEEGELSVSKVTEFLRRHRVEHPSAEQQYRAALAKAKAENKRIFIQETATWCGPCHMLTDFLLANPVWEKDYVYLRMDHRMEGAREMMQQLRDGASGGIPWYAILDAEGKKLVTSNSSRTEKNIGYPSSVDGREHFQEMINATAQRMTDREIASLMSALADED